MNSLGSRICRTYEELPEKMDTEDKAVNVFVVFVCVVGFAALALGIGIAKLVK